MIFNAATGLANVVGLVFVAAFAPDEGERHALVGPQTASSAAPARTRALAIAVGKPGAIGKPRAIPGTRGQQLYSVAGSPAGLVAFVTGTVAGHRTRVVWEQRRGVLERVLTIKVGARARGAAVAIGSRGDLLVAWEDNHAIFARHIGPTGKAQPVPKLGAGVQSAIEVRYDPSGRQEVAWMSQRVDEGEAVGPAVTYYTSATKGHDFTRAKVVGRSDITGAGRYIAAPGVRLVGSGSDSSVLAFAIYDGTNYRTVAGNVAAGQTLGVDPVSPPGVDAVLGDFAYARSGGTLSCGARARAAPTPPASSVSSRAGAQRLPRAEHRAGQRP